MLGAERATPKTALVVPALPSATVTLPIDSTGRASLSLMVAIPWASAIVAFTGDERFAEKVSFGSCAVSPFTATESVRERDPAGMVSVPEDAT